MKQLVIIGASGHGKVVADIARKTGYNAISFLDDNEAIMECGGYAVVGKSSQYVDVDCDVIVAIGNPIVRERIQKDVESAGKNIPALVHPNASIAENVEIGRGTVVVAGAVINPGARIGRGCIINTGASVDHDCEVADFVHVSVGAHVAGTVEIGERTWIGAGSTVSNNIRICADCMIGAGSVVIKNIEKPGTYIGVPAKEKIVSKHMLIGGGTAHPNNEISACALLAA